MQVLSNQLVAAIERDGGTVLMKHRVTKLQPSSSGWQVTIRTGKGAEHQRSSRDVVCSLPPQCLLELIEPDQLPKGYRKRLDSLHEPSGALVLYGVVRRDALPHPYPGHLQRGCASPGPLFVSISREGDGRAPQGQATSVSYTHLTLPTKLEV